MSYLNALRLHFAGRFQANVSTVNNDPGHFDNATFLPSYQQRQTREVLNGWFNPQGDAAWRFLGCKVTSAWTQAGAVAASDPVLAAIVADSDSRVPAKLVDLDPEQQLVSEIWGLQVRIADAGGNTLLRGDFEPAAFIDIWDRSTASAGGDTIAGAMYQSVLTNLVWADVSSSAFLTALKAAAADGLLSIKFNVDSFNLDYRSPEFMTGRIVGTIGPAAANEPRHFVLGRQFMAAADPNPLPPPDFFRPGGNINFCAGVVDATSGNFYLDLGNALLTGAGDAMVDVGDLQLHVFDPGTGADSVLGTLPSQGASGYSVDPQWYPRTAGVVVFPIPAAQRANVQQQPLYLESPVARIGESASGTFVRADTYVFRTSPGDTIRIDVYATQFGQPLANAPLVFAADASQLQPSNSINPQDVPPVATPLSAIGLADASSVYKATTDAAGKATLSLTTGDPGTPRYFGNGTDYGIDGQVYGLRPAFANAADNGIVNPWNFVSILVWSGYAQPAQPAWADVQPIFQQYANLYPVMLRFLDMGDEASVIAHADLLTLAFSLDPADPNTMPVTRDLSPARRATILAWLAAQQAPAQTPAVHTPATARPARIVPAVAADAAAPTPRGGKAAAAARRLVLQNR